MKAAQTGQGTLRSFSETAQDLGNVGPVSQQQLDEMCLGKRGLSAIAMQLAEKDRTTLGDVQSAYKGAVRTEKREVEEAIKGRGIPATRLNLERLADAEEELKNLPEVLEATRKEVDGFIGRSPEVSSLPDVCQKAMNSILSFRNALLEGSSERQAQRQCVDQSVTRAQAHVGQLAEGVQRGRVYSALETFLSHEEEVKADLKPYRTVTTELLNPLQRLDKTFQFQALEEALASPMPEAERQFVQQFYDDLRALERTLAPQQQVAIALREKISEPSYHTAEVMLERMPHQIRALKAQEAFLRQPVVCTEEQREALCTFGRMLHQMQAQSFVTGVDRYSATPEALQSQLRQQSGTHYGTKGIDRVGDEGQAIALTCSAPVGLAGHTQDFKPKDSWWPTTTDYPTGDQLNLTLVVGSKNPTFQLSGELFDRYCTVQPVRQTPRTVKVPEAQAMFTDYLTGSDPHIPSQDEMAQNAGGAYRVIEQRSNAAFLERIVTEPSLEQVYIKGHKGGLANAQMLYGVLYENIRKDLIASEKACVDLGCDGFVWTQPEAVIFAGEYPEAIAALRARAVRDVLHQEKHLFPHLQEYRPFFPGFGGIDTYTALLGGEHGVAITNGKSLSNQEESAALAGQNILSAVAGNYDPFALNVRNEHAFSLEGAVGFYTTGAVVHTTPYKGQRQADRFVHQKEAYVVPAANLHAVHARAEFDRLAFLEARQRHQMAQQEEADRQQLQGDFKQQLQALEAQRAQAEASKKKPPRGKTHHAPRGHSAGASHAQGFAERLSGARSRPLTAAEEGKPAGWWERSLHQYPGHSVSSEPWRY